MLYNAQVPVRFVCQKLKKLGYMAGRVLEDLLYCDFWSCHRAWSLVFTSPSADNDRPGLNMEGRLEPWYTMEFGSSAGDAMLWSSGVLRRHNMAR